MSRKSFIDSASSECKEQLGILIKTCRGELSLRKVTENTNLSPSNLQYIERGINAPTAEAYDMLISRLHPNANTRAKMDDCYMAIRNTPPPDVCRTVMNTAGLVDSLRAFDGESLSASQAERLRELLQSFASEIMKGEKNHVEDL